MYSAIQQVLYNPIVEKNIGWLDKVKFIEEENIKKIWAFGRSTALIKRRYKGVLYHSPIKIPGKSGTKAYGRYALEYKLKHVRYRAVLES